MKTDHLSNFAKVALQLEHEFLELERIGGQIERLEIDTESGFDRAVKLLPAFAQHGNNITEQIQIFARTLEESRLKAENIAKIVAEKAQLIQQRKQHQDEIQDKLRALGIRVQEISSRIADFNSSTPEQVPQRLKSVDEELKQFIETAQAIRKEARESRFKGIESNADSLCGTLESARRKLGLTIETLH